MQSGAIGKIREAEQEAGILVSRASQEAEEILHDARNQAAVDDQAARQAAAGIVALTLEQADLQAETLKAESREALKRDLEDLEAQAQAHQTAAVEKILRLVGAR